MKYLFFFLFFAKYFFLFFCEIDELFSFFCEIDEIFWGIFLKEAWWEYFFWNLKNFRQKCSHHAPPPSHRTWCTAAEANAAEEPLRAGLRISGPKRDVPESGGEPAPQRAAAEVQVKRRAHGCAPGSIGPDPHGAGHGR